jgi:AraC-like DNA-binding protein
VNLRPVAVPIICDTSAVPAAERWDFWADTVSQLFVPHELFGPPGVEVDARMSAADVGPLTFVSLEASGRAQRIRRTPRLVQNTPGEYYALGLVRHGTMRVICGGRQAVVRRGDLMFYDCARPYTTVADERVRVLTCAVPRDLLRVPPDRAAQLMGLAIPGHTGIGWVISPFLDRVARLAEGGMADVEGIAEGALDLIESLCVSHGSRDTPRHRSPTELLLRIRAYIETHLGDPGLSPEQIARAHHISKRSLYRLFSSHRTTVARFIQDRRLERCRADLRDPDRAHEPISSIAARYGFPNSQHFARLFRAAHGCTPREYRRAERS